MRKREDEPAGFIFFEEEEPSQPEGKPLSVTEQPTPTGEEELAVEEDSGACCGPEGDSQCSSTSTTETELPPALISEEAESDEAVFAAQLVVDGIHQFEWPLRGMDCPDCAMKATTATRRAPAVTSCDINLTDGMVKVGIDLGKGDLSRVNRILLSLGHDPDVDWLRLVGVSTETIMQRKKCDKTALRRMLLAAPGVLDVKFDRTDILIQRPPYLTSETMQEHISVLTDLTGVAVKTEVGIAPGLSHEHQRLLGASLALALLPVVLLVESLGAPFLIVSAVGFSGTLVGGLRMFREALAGIRNRILGFQVLTSLAVIGAALLGHWAEALMVVLLESVSGHLETSALLKARSAMQGGLDRLPRTARLLPSGVASLGGVASTTFSAGLTPLSSLEPARPEVEEVPIDLVQLGDRVEVRSGELIPVDGIIIEGAGQIDRAPLTGESHPIRVSEGDFVEAGLVLLRGPVVLSVEAVGEETRLSSLIDRVHTYRDIPPRIQSSVEVFTKFWVPIVILGGLLVPMFTGEWIMMLLLWVVACPCALLLAAPIPHATALANASHHGIIARGGDVLERAARCDLALLDKTGTLTSGKPMLDSILVARGVEVEDALAVAAGLESKSNHPYAATIISAAETQGVEAKQITSHLDEEAGVSGKHGRVKVRLGSLKMMQESDVEIPESLAAAAGDAQTAGLGVALLSRSSKAVALFTFNNDDLRDGAGEMVSELTELGVAVELLSGDSQSAVEKLGGRLGVEARYCRGDIDPEGKAIWVRRRSQALCTMMAGDGFNDAAALAAADVGIAVGSGESVNLEAADVLIPSEDPRIISRLIRLSRKTRLIVNLNISISILVTAILVISVVDGWHSSLALGVFIHEASAILTLINGIWLAEAGISRFGLLSDLFSDLASETAKAWRELYTLMFTKS